MLINKEHQQVLGNVKAVHMEFQHALVVADMDEEKIINVVRKTCIEGRNISLLKGVKIRKRFKEKVIELIDVGALNLFGYFKDGILKAWCLVCGKKRWRRNK